MEIREYRPGDGDELRAFWLAVGLPLTGDDDAGLDRFRERNPGLFLVAEEDGKVVGSAMGGWDGRRGWIYHLAVDPEYRRRALATELVERVEEGLRAVGCPRACVIINTDNEQGLGFWIARGYEHRDTFQYAKFL